MGVAAVWAGPSTQAALLHYVPVAKFLRRPPKQAILNKGACCVGNGTLVGAWIPSPDISHVGVRCPGQGHNAPVLQIKWAGCSRTKH
jgi:hypothetical protein